MVAAASLVALGGIIREVSRPVFPPSLPCPAGSSLRRTISEEGVVLSCLDHGTRHGPFEIWQGHTRREQGTFEQGRRTGAWRRWHGNGQRAWRASYLNGREVGAYAAFWANGELRERGSRDLSGRLLFSWSFTPAGILWSLQAPGLETRWSPATGRLRWIRDGHDWRRWHESGALTEEGSFVDGLKKGHWSAWSPRGQLQRQGIYRAGQREGTWRFWHDGGKLRARGSYHCGRVDGPWLWWHASGRRAGVGRYLVGRKMGLWQGWHASGARARRARYQAGERTGGLERFDRHGALEAVSWR